MLSKSSQTEVISSDELWVESAIEAFERSRLRNSDTKIRDYLPPATDPNFSEVLVELIRVDMELSWQDEHPARLDEYLEEFREELSSDDARNELAFEEFRLRKRSGESITPESYRAKFAINVDNWSTWARSPEREDTISIDQLSSDFQTLTDAIHHFPDIGADIAGFRVVKQIGNGRFSRVFLGRQQGLASRQVVLKIVSGISFESQRLAQLQHSNIVPIYSVHQEDELEILCMPYFGQCTLQDFLRTLDPQDIPDSGEVVFSVMRDSDQSNGSSNTPPADYLPTYVDACLWLAKQIAQGLQHAHDRDILHKDLKPANILLANDGRPMILDFNLSEQIVPGGKSCLFVGGTLPYMSPEHLASLDQPRQLDPRVDIFSFGALLFQLLTLKLPFEVSGNRSTQGMIKDRLRTPPSVTSGNKNVPPSISAMIDKCLQGEPDKRYASFRQIVFDLERHENHLPLKHTPNPSLLERTRKWCTRHQRLLSNFSLVTAGLILITILVFGMVVRHHRVRELKALDIIRHTESLLPELSASMSSPTLDRKTAKQIKDDLFEFGNQLGLGKSKQRGMLWVPNSQRNRYNDIAKKVLFLSADANLWLSKQETNSDRKQLLEDALDCTLRAKLFGEQESSALHFQEQQIRSQMGEAVIDPAVVAGVSDDQDRELAALQLLRNREFDKAAKLLERSGKDSRLDFAHWFHLANAYLAMGQINRAESYYTTCVIIWPESYLAYFHRGFCRLELKQFQLAESDFTKSLEIRPMFEPALFNRALSLKSQQRYAEAERDLSDAIAKGTQKSRIYLLRWRLRHLQGKKQEALLDWKHALAMPCFDDQDFIARGAATMKTDPRSALRDFRAAAARNPAARKAYRNVVYILAEVLGQPATALEALDLMSRNMTPHADDFMTRAVLHARLGRREASLQDIQHALHEDRSPKLLFQSACVYALHLEGLKNLENDDSRMACAFLREAILGDAKWLLRLSDPDLTHLRSHSEFHELSKLADDYRRTLTLKQ